MRTEDMVDIAWCRNQAFWASSEKLQALFKELEALLGGPGKQLLIELRRIHWELETRVVREALAEHLVHTVKDKPKKVA